MVSILPRKYREANVTDEILNARYFILHRFVIQQKILELVFTLGSLVGRGDNTMEWIQYPEPAVRV